MNARAYRIIGRLKVPPMGVADDRDFWTVPAGMAQVKISDTITPYCLNEEGVTLVETPDDVRLAGRPFLYREQYRYAKRVYSVERTEFCEAMSAQAPPTAPIFICGMGRSGSTMLAQMLTASSETRVYDEPDIFTQLATLPDTYHDLIAPATTAFAQDNRRLVLKQRSFVSYLIPAIHAVFPDARFVFLYRDPLGWIQSNLRMVLRYRVPNFVVRRLMRPMIEPYLTQREVAQLPQMHMVEIASLLWVKFMQLAQTFIANQLPVMMLRYDDFVAEPQVSLKRVLDGCALSSADMDAMLATKQQDSQQDTPLARTKLRSASLSSQQIECIRAVIDAHGWASDARLSAPSERMYG
ncbi:MAG: sulfotransferase [Chloroflexota bacterium]